MAYFTIFTRPGLSTREHRRAVRLGPRAVGSKVDQQELLTRAGFERIALTDVTREFLRTARAWYSHARDLEADLRPAIGDEPFDEQQDDLLSLITAVEEGLLSRALFAASRER
jgi:hypothetical protein